PQHPDPGRWVLSAVDVRDVVFLDQALARLRRASAILVSRIPRDRPDVRYLEHRTTLRVTMIPAPSCDSTRQKKQPHTGRPTDLIGIASVARIREGEID